MLMSKGTVKFEVKSQTHCPLKNLTSLHNEIFTAFNVKFPTISYNFFIV